MKVLPISRSTDHQYTYAGVTYPGVTNILKVIDKSDALMSWAARQTAEAAIALATQTSWADDGKDLFGDVSGLDALLATVGPEGAVKALTSRSSWKRDEAAALGTAVHGYADDHINGRPIPEDLPAVQRDYVTVYEDWWKAAGWTVRTSEAYLVHTAHGYGGTLDLLCRDRDGRTVLADIKTGKGVYSEAVLQLAAYGAAELIQTPAGDLFPMPAVDRYAILHVTKDGVREIEVSIGALELLAWGAAIDLYQWHRTVKGKRL
jgi:hypothetical protein